MVRVCIYCGRKAEHGVRRLISFPLGNTKFLQSWLEKLDFGPNFIPTKNSKLCSDHFEKECLNGLDNSRDVLVEGSVPTLFDKCIRKFCVCCGATYDASVRRSFHTFPLHNMKLFETWMESIGLERSKIRDSSRICSDHFDDDSFLHGDRKTGHLKRDNAVPNIFNYRRSIVFPVRGGKKFPEKTDLLPLPPLRYFRKSSKENEVPNFYSSGDATVTMNGSEISTSDEPGDPSFLMCDAGPSDIFENVVFLDEPINEPLHPTSPSENEQSLIQNDLSSIDRHGDPTDKQRQLAPGEIVEHDHSYGISPNELKEKLKKKRVQIKEMKLKLRMKTQRIRRLTKKVNSLKDLVSELRRTNQLCDSGFACLDSIAACDTDSDCL